MFSHVTVVFIHIVDIRYRYGYYNSMVNGYTYNYYVFFFNLLFLKIQI